LWLHWLDSILQPSSDFFSGAFEPKEQEFRTVEDGNKSGSQSTTLSIDFFFKKEHKSLFSLIMSCKNSCLTSSSLSSFLRSLNREVRIPDNTLGVLKLK
jgi:hypothetical protein